MADEYAENVTVQFPKSCALAIAPIEPVLRRISTLGVSGVILALGAAALTVISVLGIMGDGIPRAVVMLSTSATWVAFFLLRGELDREHCARQIAAAEARMREYLIAEFQDIHNLIARGVSDVRTQIADAQVETNVRIDGLPGRVDALVTNSQADALLAADTPPPNTYGTALRSTPTHGVRLSVIRQGVGQDM